MKDEQILRKLAREYLKCARHEHNTKMVELHKAVNDLHMIRPVVLIDELPWDQMNFNGELTCYCQDPYLRTIEEDLRRDIYKFKYLRADMILKPYISIPKISTDSGFGISYSQTTIPCENSHILSHDYDDHLSTEEQVENIHNTVVTYDEKETKRRFNLVGEIVGDIIPVKMTGKSFFGMNPWDKISAARGVTNLLIDLAERPEFMHRLMKKIADTSMNMLEQEMALGLFDNDPTYLHCTAASTDDLNRDNLPNDKMEFSNLWGRGAAQIFASVSKEMHDEYDIQYQKHTIGKCGLVYYGCCEPLDRKIDIVEKLPNLRKISITPWANVNIAAEAIGKKYVMASKPNPASVGLGKLDEDELKREITEIVNAGKRNSCSFELTLKDISTCGNNPETIFKWEKIVMDIVNSY